MNHQGAKKTSRAEPRPNQGTKGRGNGHFNPDFSTFLSSSLFVFHHHHLAHHRPLTLTLLPRHRPRRRPCLTLHSRRPTFRCFTGPTSASSIPAKQPSCSYMAASSLWTSSRRRCRMSDSLVRLTHVASSHSPNAFNPIRQIQPHRVRPAVVRAHDQRRRPSQGRICRGRRDHAGAGQARSAG